ncbi:MAG: hypothetical protein LBR80_10945 [Deltaproteobacteria bacterium]|jgi:hypothetical protein|nr:hypothetical protein [Deltaproteobacteria bacterium]
MIASNARTLTIPDVPVSTPHDPKKAQSAKQIYQWNIAFYDTTAWFATSTNMMNFTKGAERPIRSNVMGRSWFPPARSFGNCFLKVCNAVLESMKVYEVSEVYDKDLNLDGKELNPTEMELIKFYKSPDRRFYRSPLPSHGKMGHTVDPKYHTDADDIYRTTSVTAQSKCP